MADAIFTIEYLDTLSNINERIRVEEDDSGLLHSLWQLDDTGAWVLEDRVNRIDPDRPPYKYTRDRLVKYLMDMYAKDHVKDFRVILH